MHSSKIYILALYFCCVFPSFICANDKLSNAEIIPKIEYQSNNKIEDLFNKLKEAKDSYAANKISKQIELLFLHSDNSIADLMLTRAKKALETKKSEAAINVLDYAIKLQPKRAASYYYRAVSLISIGDIDGALRDLNSALTYEARLFPALILSGIIMLELGKNKTACKFFDKTSEISPYLGNIQDMIKNVCQNEKGLPI